jgi:hypothetical protein
VIIRGVFWDCKSQISGIFSAVKFGSCRQIGEAGVVLVYYDPFELTTFQQEYGDDPVSHQSFAE